MTVAADVDQALRRWRDRSTALDLFLDHGALVTTFARCVVTRFDGSSLTLANRNLKIGLAIGHAQLAYIDILARIPADADMSHEHGVCEIRIKFPHGPTAILIEMANRPEGAHSDG